MVLCIHPNLSSQHSVDSSHPPKQISEKEMDNDTSKTQPMIDCVQVQPKLVGLRPVFKARRKIL